MVCERVCRDPVDRDETREGEREPAGRKQRDPVIAGRGSAIFLHDDTGRPTNGCVSLPPAELDLVLRWLDPAQGPQIVIGVG